MCNNECKKIKRQILVLEFVNIDNEDLFNFSRPIDLCTLEYAEQNYDYLDLVWYDMKGKQIRAIKNIHHYYNMDRWGIAEYTKDNFNLKIEVYFPLYKVNEAILKLTNHAKNETISKNSLESLSDDSMIINFKECDDFSDSETMTFVVTNLSDFELNEEKFINRLTTLLAVDNWEKVTYCPYDDMSHCCEWDNCEECEFYDKEQEME